MGAICGIGGVAGKQLFTTLRDAAPDSDMVGGVQAVCLAVIIAISVYNTWRYLGA